MFWPTTFRHVNSKQIWLPNTLGMLVEDDAVLTGKKTIIFYHKCRKQRKKEKNIKNKRFPSKKSKPAGGFSKAQNRESSAEITSFGVVCHQDNIYRFFIHHKMIQILRSKIHCHCVKLILVDMLLYYWMWGCLKLCFQFFNELFKIFQNSVITLISHDTHLFLPWLTWKQ